MTEKKTYDTWDWDVRLKGEMHPILVTEARPPQGDMEASLLYFADETGATKAVFPVNAVSSVVRSVGHGLAVYPLDVTPAGAFIRNVKADGTGHWVPYTGKLYGVKE